MNKDIEKILVTTEQLKDLTSRLGKQISNDFQGKTPIL